MRIFVGADAVLRGVRFAAFGIWGITALVGLVLGSHGLWLTGERKRLAAEVGQLDAEIQAAKATLEQAARLEVPATLRGLAAVSAFQRELEGLCRASGAQLTEFSSGSDLLPFVTRFSLGTQESDWKETGVGFTARGTEQQVVSVLLGLSRQPIPMEITSLDLERIASDRMGNATVEARARVRVLSKSA